MIEFTRKKMETIFDHKKIRARKNILWFLKTETFFCQKFFSFSKMIKDKSIKRKKIISFSILFIKTKKNEI